MPLKLETSISYLRGEFIPFAEANLSIASSSILYGLSIYTVFNVIYKDEKLYTFRLREHYERLCNSSRIMSMSPFETFISFSDFKNVVKNLLEKNKVQENALVRIAYFIDENAAGTRIHGLSTEMSAYVLPLKLFYGKTEIDACMSSWIHVASNMIPPRAKVNGSYANACLMKNEALQKGFDEAISLNSAGFVSEVTVANLFIVKNGELFTPDLESDILEGITRNTVMQLAKIKGISCEEKKITKEELFDADEVFLSGSSAHIISIKSIDGKKMPSTKFGKEFAEMYEDVRMGKIPEFKEWLQEV
jgi:branched-chain amino acid aminotransferase